MQYKFTFRKRYDLALEMINKALLGQSITDIEWSKYLRLIKKDIDNGQHWAQNIKRES